MTLLGVTGFESGVVPFGWGSNGVVNAGGLSPTSAYYLYLGTLKNAAYSLVTPVNKLFYGQRISGTLRSDAGWLSILGNANATTHLTVSPDATGALVLRRGTATGTTLATSASGVVAADTPCFMEVSATIADTGGVCEVKVNGVSVISYTGDTKNSGTLNTISGVAIAYPNASGSISIDDVYICDDAGSAPFSTYLGDVAIASGVASADGASSQYLGSDGNSLSNYQLVDERPWSSTDYVGDATVGHRDLYEFTDIDSSFTVLAVQVNVQVEKSDAGVRSYKILARNSGGTVLASSDQTLSTAWSPAVGPVMITDAAGSAWTAASLNTHQFGIETS